MRLVSAVPTILLTATLLLVDAHSSSVAADEPTKDGAWTVERTPALTIRTRELTLHPRGEPRPALKHRLLSDDFDLVDGNAAIYYLKAMGFLEQNPARDRLSEIQKQASQLARSEEKDLIQVPPYSYQSMSPKELPLEEVKQYLQLTSFQPPLLREAARRRTMDLDRRIRSVENPIAYLLPEVQTMRELARTQSVRCRVAIAENRLDDAIAILGEQYALARHLGQDEFLVSGLVGIACANIAWDDALYLVEQAEAPNLYWAFAALPESMFELRPAYDYERQFLYEQFKVLREVDETLRPAGYWSDFLDRLIPQLGVMASELSLPSDDPEMVRAALVGYIAAAYPSAKRYLIDEVRLPREQVEAYPTAQTVFLAAVRYYDRARDDFFKWTLLPYWEARQAGASPDELFRSQSDRVGLIAYPANLLLPAFNGIRTASARAQQAVALIQTVEAIRMYGAANDGKLPANLEELPLPSPPDPFTGKPLDYEFKNDHAIFSGHPAPGIQYRLMLRFAAPPVE